MDFPTLINKCDLNVITTKTVLHRSQARDFYVVKNRMQVQPVFKIQSQQSIGLCLVEWFLKSRISDFLERKIVLRKNVLLSSLILLVNVVHAIMMNLTNLMQALGRSSNYKY